MKKIFILVLILVSFAGKSVTCTWIGGSGTSFTTTANWLLGVVPIPGNGDDILFGPLGGSNNCVIPTTNLSGIDVNSFSVMAGYTGNIDMGGDDHAIAATFVINAGNVISTSGSLFMGGTALFSLGGTGVFTHNSGTISISSSSGNTFTFSGAIILKTLNLNVPAGLTGARNIDFGSNLTADNINLAAIGNKIYAFQGTVHVKVGLSLGNSSHITNSPTNSGTFIFDGSSATIVGTSAGAGTAYLCNIQINTTGTCAMSGNINVRGDWTGTAGTVLNTGTSFVNMYGTSATISGAAAAFNNLAIQTGASVSLPANEILISGSLTKTGTLNFSSAGSIGFNGTSAQAANLAGASISAITCYGTGSRAITLSGAIDVLNVLTVGTGVTLTTGGSMTLKANNPIKARLAPVGSGASITDNVTVETLIPAGATGWSMLGVSGVNGQHISDWDKYPADLNGLPMTCVGCTYDPSVAGNFYSIQGWDEGSTDGYDTLAVDINSGTALTPGKGFWVYAGNGATTSTDIKLSNKGTLVTGPKSIAVTLSAQSGFNLVANPYASPINWDDMYTFVSQNNGGVGPTIYTYGDNGDSQLTADGVGGGGTGGFAATSVLAAGQGFYVEALSNSTVDFDETGKSSTNTGAIFKPATAIQMFRLKITGATDNDDELFRFIPNATPFFDIKYDAHKLFSSPGYAGYPGSYDKYTTISSKDAFDVDYSIHSMPLLTQSLTIPVLARVSAAGSYTISAYDFKNFTSCVGLMDKVTNTFHDLRQADYVFTINDTTAVPRFDLLLCKDATIDETSISQIYSQSPSILINQDQESPFVKMAFPKNTKATISVYNIMGQKLMEDVTVEGTATTTRLNTDLHNQVVLIRVVTDKESSTKKIILH